MSINDSQVLTMTLDGGVGVITLNRPSKLNAMSTSLVDEFEDSLIRFENDPEVNCVVITGAGDRAFSAGGDLHEVVAASPDELKKRSEQSATFYWHLANYKKPTIGAINGLALGAAALLASSLDIRIGCERSSFRFLAAAYGRVNSTWTLPLIVGWPRAKELLYTAREIRADEAYEIGLLNKVVASDQLFDSAVEMARQIASNTPEIVQGIKELISEDVGKTWRDMYDTERRAIASHLQVGTVQDGFKEFLDRKQTDST